MGEAVTVSAKKDFIRWFLSRYQLRKKEAIWLFNYLLSDQRLLEKIHFTEDLRNRDKTIVVSTICSQAIPFQFQKLSKVYYDVERAFHDIRLNPDEDVFVSIYFKDRLLCSQYQSVLEGFSVNGQSIAGDDVMSLIAEIIMDRARRVYRLEQLYIEIDRALEMGDKNKFVQLAREWKELKMLEDDLER